jgi:DNA-binding transcriptional LysR family regulator
MLLTDNFRGTRVNLNRLAYFAAVVDAGSFTRAADRLGISKAVVSQQVARLEADVGTTLLVRTTRKVYPTEAGRTFHARCAFILREAEEAFGELRQAISAPTGTLRITAPFDYGTSRVLPATIEFTRKYPACRIDLSLGDRSIDFVAEGFDMAIRVGWLADSSLQARRIGSFRQLLVCAPELRQVAAALNAPDGLEALPFVAHKGLREPLEWHFTRNEIESRSVRVQASVSVDATLAVHAAVLAGAGLSVLPDYLIAADLFSERLIHVLPEWELPSGGIHAVFPTARYRPAKVSAFAGMLIAAERAAQDPSTASLPARR